jgi:DNA-binding NarL/FixJ family response regulator
MKPIRVLLADDHALVRAGIRALLEGLAGVEVIAEASNGLDALALLKAKQPDVALVDIAMPGLNGLEVVARAAIACPHVRVLLLSMHANEEYVMQALRAGAAGYLIKGANPAELEVAVQAAARGETYLSPAVSKHVVHDVRQRAAETDNPFERLTPRQREVLQLIAEGRTTKEIARALKIGVKTVETHRAQLMARLNIHDVAGLVRYAIRQGLVKTD